MKRFIQDHTVSYSSRTWAQLFIQCSYLTQHIAFHTAADRVLANVVVERASDLKLEDLG